MVCVSTVWCAMLKTMAMLPYSDIFGNAVLLAIGYIELRTRVMILYWSLSGDTPLNYGEETVSSSLLVKSLVEKMHQGHELP